MKSASTTRATAQPAPTHLHDPVLKGPAYIHGQASPYGYDSAYAYDPSCADGGCYDGFYGGWSCYPQLKHWGSVEYLLWWRKGMRIPPLVSTGPVPPNAVLFGGRNLDFGPQSGGRATFGAWLDDYECIGLGARFFGLSDGRVDFRQTAAGPGTLARPFIDADTGAPNAVDVGGALGGGLDIALESEVFAAEALFRRRIECGFCGRLDLLGGYTYTQINEEIGIRTFTTLPPGPPNALNVFDVFDADNEFHGGTVGLQAEFDRGRFTVGMLSKISFGTMHETVTILGGNNNPAAAPGLQGLLAQNTNIGEFEQDEFAVVPEVNLTLGFRATEHVELVAGYSMVYWSHVVQPGDHIDLTVDLTPTAATTRPAFNFDSTDYWVMGMNFGMQWSY
ncbi:MAG: BBP7 family outer membrane beta-barrel protein [Planctomycetes bacterium]|nr:BBP7 family outer membrane beta-barrel protein [Planctomycetota bacterium]